MTKKYSEILARTKSQFATLVSGNYSLTPAIPKIIKGRKCEIYFAYLITRNKKIPRPYLKITADFNTGNILDYRNAYCDDFTDSAKYPLNTEFDAQVPVAKTPHEQLNLLNNLNALYERIRTIAFVDVNSTEEKNLLTEYVEILNKTIPAALLTFCQNTESEFFYWLKNSIQH